MVDIDVRPQAGLAHGGGPALDLVTSKLQPPVVRPGSIRRSSLVERLGRDDSRPVVSVAAPVGYGKTTLLSQWAERNGHAFAWVSVDEADNDPKVLLTYVAEALNAVEPVSGRVFDALASPASSVPGSVVPRLGAALAAMTSPVVLVLDDVHLLYNSECRAALSVLADHVPGGSRLAFAGRSGPPVRVARLRAEGKIVEVGAGDLALDRGEAAALLRKAGTLLRRGGIEDSYAAPLVAAVPARTALRRGDAPAVRQQLVRAQRLRHLQTYAVPHVAVQVRVELIRVHAALGDLSGARTLMREINEVLKRRPGLGTLAGQAGALRVQLARERGSSVPGASALTAAELRLLPLLSTHLSVPEIAAELILSPHTIKSRIKSIYRKMDVTTRNQAVIRARERGLLEG